MTDAVDTFAKAAGVVFSLVFGSGMLWRWSAKHRQEGRQAQQLDTLIDSVKELTISFKAYVTKTDERFSRYDDRFGRYAERVTRVEEKVDAIYPSHFRRPRLADE